MGTVIGIDLGTTNCAVAFINSRGDAEILQNSEGDNTTPSVVQFDGEDIIVGKEAKNSHVVSPDETVAFAKRHMDNPASLGFNITGKEYTAIDISAIILKKLKENAEKKLNDTVEEAVITVPAYFDNVAKEATKQAAEIAGLKVLRLIMEPSAAALYYSYMNDNKLEGKRVLVYDLGGGTFDVSIVDLNSGTVDVIATEGDPKLGGKDFDERLIDYMKEIVNSEFPNEVDWDDIEVKAELYEKAEDIKRSLSSKSSVRLRFSFAKKFKGEITREKFEELVSSLIYNTINIMNSTITEAKNKDGKDIDEVLLVGGSTKMPFIESAIQKEIGISALNTVNPDEVVAQGAALLATNLSITESDNVSQAAQDLPQNIKDSVLLMKVNDIVPHSLGFIYWNGTENKNKIVITHGTKIPATSEVVSGFSMPSQVAQVDFKVTQGEDEDVDLVEKIGSTPVARPDGFPLDQDVPVEIVYSYDENGLIHVQGKLGGQNFELEVKSEHKLNNNLVASKRNELSAKEIE